MERLEVRGHFFTRISDGSTKLFLCDKQVICGGFFPFFYIYISFFCLFKRSTYDIFIVNANGRHLAVTGLNTNQMETIIMIYFISWWVYVLRIHLPVYTISLFSNLCHFSAISPFPFFPFLSFFSFFSKLYLQSLKRAH